MNILFVNSSKTWGGGEVWLEQICESLGERGHRVIVACQPESKLFSSLLVKGIEVTGVKINGDFNPSTIVKLFLLIRSKDIDIVCTNMEKDLRLGGIAARLARVPVIISKEVDFPIKNKRINRFFYNRIASGVMVNSYATYNTLLVSAPWLQEQEIEIVWKGIDVASFRVNGIATVREKYHLTSEDVIMGFVGTLNEQKGIPTLLEAMRIVAIREPRVKLILAGTGNLLPMIEEFRIRHKLQNNIILSGYQTDVRTFLHGIDFLVMPSYWEGFGYAAAEAMAAGKPVIGTHTSSLSEIIEDGCTGILVPPRSHEDLSAAILRLCGNPKLIESMGREGCARVTKLFQLNRMVTETESFLKRIVSASSIANDSLTSDSPSLPLSDRSISFGTGSRPESLNPLFRKTGS